MSNKCQVIHETIIRDIIDIVKDVKDTDEVKLIKKGNSFRSIAQASSNLTIVFPTIVSKNASIDAAAMISKATERKAVSMLQILFSALCVTDADNAIDYIKNFHNNLNIDSDLTVDNFIDAMDKYVIENESCLINPELYNMVKQDLRNLNYTLPENISEHGLDNFKVYPSSYYGKEAIIQEKASDDDKASENLKFNDAVNKVSDAVIKSIKKKNITSYNLTNHKDASATIKNLTDVVKNQLLDSDVKKCNELVPTMMIINFITKKEGTQGIAQQAIIGVKSKIYPVDSTDVINRIILKNQDKQGLLKFIKATTREISFCRDFLFAIDKAKLDALSQSKRGSSSKLWKILERRALKSKIRRNLRSINDATAISTLVITQEEVEYLKKEGIDITSPKTVRGIMESYNLMGFCIVDESMEVAYFIYDTGDDIYEQVPFKQLEKESSNSEYKKIVNLMTKMR